MIDLNQLVRLLEEDEKGRGKIADILASEIALRNRRLIIEAVLKEVATKEDLRELEERLRRDLSATRKDLTELEERLRRDLSATRKDLTELEERLRRDLKEYINLRFETFEEKFNERLLSLEKRFELLTKFTTATFIGIMLTLASVVLTRLL